MNCESDFLKMPPKGRIGLARYAGIGDDQPGKTHGSRSKGHRNAVVAVWVDNRRLLGDGNFFAIP